MSEIRRILADLGPVAAASLPIWRDAVVAVLALVVVGCLWFYAEASGV